MTYTYHDWVVCSMVNDAIRRPKTIANENLNYVVAAAPHDVDRNVASCRCKLSILFVWLNLVSVYVVNNYTHSHTHARMRQKSQRTGSVCRKIQLFSVFSFVRANVCFVIQ